jgi:aspartyl-tRNA(Asn)/glutamyl-tRNA(Gln) amidotransferase subunit C
VADEITPQVFQHLVELAALELDDHEADYLRRELNSQLKAIGELEAIDLDGDIPITSHGVPYRDESRPALREDAARPSTHADAILSQAPQRDGRYVVVPDIHHTELG